jgi:hypothetical protein
MLPSLVKNKGILIVATQYFGFGSRFPSPGMNCNPEELHLVIWPMCGKMRAGFSAASPQGPMFDLVSRL